MRTRGFRVVLGVLVAAGVFAAGGVAYASHQFNDVPNSNFFHDDIDFLASRGVTLGCGGGNFCPDDNVTRRQMAAFMRRFAEAISPVIVEARTTESVASGAVICITDPHVAPFEQVVTLTGGVYQRGTPSNFADRLSARVVVRRNGGTWSDVSGAWSMADSPGTDSTGYSNSTTTGFSELEPGQSYEFALRVGANGDLTAGADDGCQLLGIVQHRMPGANLAALSAVPPVDTDTSETNGGG